MERPDIDMEKVFEDAMDSKLSYNEAIWLALIQYEPIIRIALIQETELQEKFPGMTWEDWLGDAQLLLDLSK